MGHAQGSHSVEIGPKTLKLKPQTPTNAQMLLFFLRFAGSFPEEPSDGPCGYAARWSPRGARSANRAPRSALCHMAAFEIMPPPKTRIQAFPRLVTVLFVYS